MPLSPYYHAYSPFLIFTSTVIFVNPSACLAIIIIIINVIITTIQERVSSTSSSTFATFATLSHYFYPLTLSADKGRRGGLHCWSESAQIEFVIGINYLRGISTPFCHLQLSCQVSVARSSLFTFHPPPTTLLTHSLNGPFITETTTTRPVWEDFRCLVRVRSCPLSTYSRNHFT